MYQWMKKKGTSWNFAFWQQVLCGKRKNLSNFSWISKTHCFKTESLNPKTFTFLSHNFLSNKKEVLSKVTRSSNFLYLISSVLQHLSKSKDSKKIQKSSWCSFLRYISSKLMRFFFDNLEIQAQKWDYFEIFGSIDIDWSVWLEMKKATGTLKYFTISSKNSFLNNVCSVWSKEMKFNGVTSLYKNKSGWPQTPAANDLLNNCWYFTKKDFVYLLTTRARYKINKVIFKKVFRLSRLSKASFFVKRVRTCCLEKD